MSYTREQLENWLKAIDVDAERVLDIGGAQLPIKGRTKSWDVHDYQILDLPKPHETKEKPTQTMDLNDPILDESDGFDDVTYLSFDVVFCLEVMEYIWNPVQAMSNIYSFMKEGGKLYMSVPFIYPVHNPKDEDYLRYTEKGIIKVLENAGFEIQEIIMRNAKYPEMLEGFWNAEGMKASRDYSKHDAVGWLIEAVKL